MKEQDLKDLSNDEIRDFFINEDWSDIKNPIIKDFISKGIDKHDIGSKLNRVGRILSIIIVSRFINKEIL